MNRWRLIAYSGLSQRRRERHPGCPQRAGWAPGGPGISAGLTAPAARTSPTGTPPESHRTITLGVPEQPSATGRTRKAKYTSTPARNFRYPQERSAVQRTQAH